MKVRKTMYAERKNYTYEFADGERNTIKPGEMQDGTVITEELIHLLHCCDDAEVYNNLKNAHPPISEEEKAYHRAHPDESVTKWNYSFSFLTEKGDMEDKSRVLYQASLSYETGSELSERMTEMLGKMTELQRMAFQLTEIDGCSFREAAIFMKCSAPNVKKHHDRAIRYIREHFFENSSQGG